MVPFESIDYVIMYAAQTARDGIRFTNDPDAKLHGSSDPD